MILLLENRVEAPYDQYHKSRSLGFLSLHTFSVKQKTYQNSVTAPSPGWVCFECFRILPFDNDYIWIIHSGELIWPEYPLFVDVLPVKHSGISMDFYCHAIHVS